MNNPLSQIRETLLNEALASPLLLSDLAQMETYISESYEGRSLIELLQNADDAGAKRFHIDTTDGASFIAANDGRPFNELDLFALCRSGNSTKARKGGTIGFRGIGFKSVVNYSSGVDMKSGAFEVSFSKELTNKAVPTAERVPLIRIPHQLANPESIQKLDETLAQGYQTAFRFLAAREGISREIAQFDSGCLLFLGNIEEVQFKMPEGTRMFSVRRQQTSGNTSRIKIVSAEGMSEWLVKGSTRNASVAFKLDSGIARPCSQEEAVVHSFMPTQERLSIPLKLNADFSTDPSRTKIIYDEETESSISNCANLLAEIALEAIRCGNDPSGFIEVLSKAEIAPLRYLQGESVNDSLVEQFHSKVQSEMETSSTESSTIYLQPQGITDDDFEAMSAKLGVKGYGNRDERQIPGLCKLLHGCGFKELTTAEMLSCAQTEIYSEATRLYIIESIIKESKFGLSPKTKALLTGALLFSASKGVSALGSKDELKISDSFAAAIRERTSEGDYLRFAAQAGIKPTKPKTKQKTVVKANKFSMPIGASTSRWRTSEQAITELLKSLPEFADAVDVSSRNLGYDVEALNHDGGRYYYEVKTVEYIGQSFSMTNNEFTSAVQLKDRYRLAIVHRGGKGMIVCFIVDPINALQLEKRATRWDWHCQSYAGKTLTVEYGNGEVE